MVTYGGVEVEFHAFLTSVLEGVEQSNSSPGLFTPGEKARYSLDRRLGGPQSRSGRSDEEKSPCPCRETNPGRSDPSIVVILSYHGFS